MMEKLQTNPAQSDDFRSLIRLTADLDLQGLLDLLHKTTKKTVILYTTDKQKLLASGENSCEDNNLLKFLLSKMSSTENFEHDLDMKRTIKPTGTEGVWYNIYDNGQEAMETQLYDGKTLMATLALISRTQPFLPEDSETAKLFAQLITSRLKLLYPPRDVKSAINEQNELSDINMGTQWLRKLNGHRFRNFRLAVMQLDGPVESQYSALYPRLKQAAVFCRVGRMDEMVAALYNLESSSDYDSLCSSLSSIAEEFQLPIGISGQFDNTEKLHDRFEQANSTRTAGAFFYCQPKLYQFDNMLEMSLLYDAWRMFPSGPFRNPSLDALKETDRINGTEYDKTLRAFVSCGGSRKETSSVLNIHRNTLNYRLEKIEDILGFSLDNSEVILECWFFNKLSDCFSEKQNIMSAAL